jgi:transcriptional regulator with XRE-family HTH domain
MNKFTRNIRIFRQLRNFSQGYMAKQLGMSQPNFARIENGQVPLVANTLEQISAVLGFSTEILMHFDHDKISGFPNEKAYKYIDVESETGFENRMNKLESSLIELSTLMVNLSQCVSCKCKTTS